MKNLFEDYILDFANDSKEAMEEKLDNQNKGFDLFKDLYQHGYGTINIDDNLIDIHTGGWSENEALIRDFKQTWWWSSNLVLERRGGHYYFDTNKEYKTKKEWKITKTQNTQ